MIDKYNGDIKKIKTFSPGIFGDPATIIIVCRDLKRAYEVCSELGRDTLSYDGYLNGQSEHHAGSI